jgi:hypothetical protein
MPRHRRSHRSHRRGGGFWSDFASSLVNALINIFSGSSTDNSGPLTLSQDPTHWAYQGDWWSKGIVGHGHRRRRHRGGRRRHRRH